MRVVYSTLKPRVVVVSPYPIYLSPFHKPVPNERRHRSIRDMSRLSITTVVETIREESTSKELDVSIFKQLKEVVRDPLVHQGESKKDFTRVEWDLPGWPVVGSTVGFGDQEPLRIRNGVFWEPYTPLGCPSRRVMGESFTNRERKWQI